MYYHNGRTGKTSWAKPAALMSEGEKAEQAALAHMGWAKFKGAEGEYFYHEKSGTSSWKRPFSTRAFESNWGEVKRFVAADLARRHGGVPARERATIADRATAKVMDKHHASKDATFLRKEADSIIKLLDKYVARQ